VVQTKAESPLRSDIPAETKANPPADMKKKDFSEGFIVYNEDFPMEELPDTVPPDNELPDGIQADVSHFSSEPEESGNTTSEKDSGEDLDYKGVGEIKRKLNELAKSDAEEAKKNEPEVPVTDSPVYGNDVTTRNDDSDDNDYSDRYLQKLKDMPLPELDDINSFDPDDFMREYRRGKDKDDSLPPDREYSQPAPEKHWLEIEEALPGQTNGIASKETQASDLSVGAPAERRYRDDGYIVQPGKRTVSKRKEPKRARSLVSVLLWLVLSAAFLVCFIFFDRYVQSAYGDYDSFLYTITEGKIDLNPGSK